MIYGQSNAEYPLCLITGNERFKNINNPYIRYIRSYNIEPEFQFATPRPALPQEEIKATDWRKADSYEQIVEASGLGIMMGELLFKEQNVPVALLSVACGGTPIEAWLKKSDIDANKEVKEYLIQRGLYLNEDDYNKRGTDNYAQMSGLYNEKLYPLQKYNIKGAVWYQGESNTGGYREGLVYREMLKLLLNRTRHDFRDPKLPIILCNIAAYNYGTRFFEEAFINEAINSFAQDEQTFPIPIYDLPLDWQNGKPYYDWLEWHPIHPTDKAPLTKRVAKVFLSNQPKQLFTRYVSFRKDQNNLVLIFSGAKLKPAETLCGFALSDEKGIYYEAEVKIISPYEATLSSPYVKAPQNAAYAFFKYNEMCNLFNEYDLPVLPFRTKAEEVINDSYYTFPRFLNCDEPKTLEIGGAPEFGGAYYKDTWAPGSIIPSNTLSLMFDEDIKTEGKSSLRIKYERSEYANFYFSAAPFISISGAIVPFENYGYLSIDIMADAKCEFRGIIGKTNRNEIIKFNVINSHELKSEFTTFIVDMHQPVDSNSRSTTYKPLFEMELVFSAENDVTVRIDHLVLHNEKLD